jgi:Putative phage serine protease XkdF
MTPMNDEQRYVLGIAYQAGPDPRIMRGADGGRDYFTAAELEKAAWKFMKSNRYIGLNHEDGTEGAAELVECYIHHLGNVDVGDGLIVKNGDWLIGAILDEPSWALYKAGKITGFSPQGSAIRRRSAQQ